MHVEDSAFYVYFGGCCFRVAVAKYNTAMCLRAFSTVRCSSLVRVAVALVVAAAVATAQTCWLTGCILLFPAVFSRCSFVAKHDTFGYCWHPHTQYIGLCGPLFSWALAGSFPLPSL